CDSSDAPFTPLTDSSAGEQFQHMPVEIAKIDAPAALTMIQLTIGRAPGIAAPFDARILHALEDGVELIVADMERIMVDVKRIGIVEVQCQFIINFHRGKVPRGSLIGKSKDVC